jgi:hypothetical protein
MSCHAPTCSQCQTLSDILDNLSDPSLYTLSAPNNTGRFPNELAAHKMERDWAELSPNEQDQVASHISGLFDGDGSLGIYFGGLNKGEVNPLTVPAVLDYGGKLASGAMRPEDLPDKTLRPNFRLMFNIASHTMGE